MAHLTGREIAVLKYLAHVGLTTSGILSLSVRTVEGHKASAMRKLDLHSTGSLVDFVNEHPEILRGQALPDVPVSNPRPAIRLSPREQEVFELIVQGKAHGEISIDLEMSRQMVRNYTHRILRRSGFKHRCALIAETWKARVVALEKELGR